MDLLAGKVSDSQLQRLLEQATPPDVSAAAAAATIGVAWARLRQDLAAGGWTRLHRQAAVARAATAGDPPAVVDVTIVWSGLSRARGFVDRRRNVVRLTAAGATWRSARIS